MVDLADFFDWLSQSIPYTNLTYFQVLVAVVILVVGFVAVRIVVRTVKKGLKKIEVPPLVVEFAGRFLRYILYIVVILLAVGTLGFSVDSAILGLSAIVGLVLAFGMKDVISNLAAGVWIAIQRPFKMGETVTINGMKGKVIAVGLMATEIVTWDNLFITIPNNIIWGSPLINDTRMPTRVTNVAINVAYGSDLNKAFELAMDVMKNNPKVLKDPKPEVIMDELADSSINLQLRARTKTGDYWSVKRALMQAIVERYQAEGIEIPFPQMDVNLKKAE